MYCGGGREWWAWAPVPQCAGGCRGTCRCCRSTMGVLGKEIKADL